MDNYKSVFYLTVYYIIFVMICGFILIVLNKQYIIDNWHLYRCNPMVIPFADFFGFESTENMINCMNSNFTGTFDIFIRPFKFMIASISKIMGNSTNQLNSIRYMIKPIRDFFASASSMVFKRVEAVMGTVIYSFLKINDLLKRVFANFRLAVYSLEASQMSVRSVWDGPVGQITRFWAPGVDFFSEFFCFSPDTRINGVAIRDIALNDHIYGKMVVFSPSRMYSYDNVVVSGNHLVYHRNKWVRVKYVGVPVPARHPVIYSLYTTDHRIQINNSLFCDYEETDQMFTVQKRMILKGLDSPCSTIQNNDPNLLAAWVNICMADGKYKAISQLKLGDKLYNNDRVLGIIYQKKAILLSPDGIGLNNIVYNDPKKAWYLLSQVEPPTTIEAKNDIFYNIVTKNGFFYTNTRIVRDYLELHSPSIFDAVGDLTIDHLQKQNSINIIDT